VTVAGDEEEHNQALQALRHAAPFVRKQLGLSLNLPRTPRFFFSSEIGSKNRESASINCSMELNENGSVRERMKDEDRDVRRSSSRLPLSATT